MRADFGCEDSAEGVKGQGIGSGVVARIRLVSINIAKYWYR